MIVLERTSVPMDNAYLTILFVERIGNALKVTGAKKMFANLMVIPAREIQTVLSINYVLMDIVISHLLKYIAIIRCNVLQSMTVLKINALNVDMHPIMKDPFREVDHLVNQIQIVNLTLIAMKMNHARMAIVYSAIVIQDKYACTVCAKRKWSVTERKNAIMDKFVSVKNVTKFVKVEHCVLKNISVDLMFVCQTNHAMMTVMKWSQNVTNKKNVILAFGVS